MRAHLLCPRVRSGRLGGEPAGHAGAPRGLRRPACLARAPDIMVSLRFTERTRVQAGKIKDFHNAFCFYKRKTLIDHPMPEKYSGKEDRYWAKYITEKGYTYLYNPKFKFNARFFLLYEYSARISLALS